MLTRKWYLIFIILLNLQAAVLRAESFTLQMDGQKVQVEFYTINNVLVNDICKEKLQTCKAMSIYKKSSVFFNKLELGGLSSKAQAYCKYLKGTPLNLIDDKGAQSAFCAFADMSMISSWDLFNSHSKKQGKK